MIKPLHIIVHQILSAYLRKNLLILEMLLNIFFLQFIYIENTFKGYKYAYFYMVGKSLGIKKRTRLFVVSF